MTHPKNAEYQAKWYKANKKKHMKRVAERKRKIREWFKEYKATLSCEECGMNHPAVIDFHHINPKEKDRKVSSYMDMGWSRRRILKEISKCRVLCANCHRILHYNERT